MPPEPSQRKMKAKWYMPAEGTATTSLRVCQSDWRLSLLPPSSAIHVEGVEVVRGIPSAEYGDLTSGMVVVHSKIGVTPWQLKGKVNPGLMNYSLG